MKISKKLFTTLAALGLTACFLAAPAIAQPGRGHGDHAQRVEKRLNMMKQQLDLTPDQAERIRQIFDAAHTQRQAKRERFKAILTPEQQAMMEQWRQERKNTPKAERKRGNMKEKFAQLGLTEDQKAQLKALKAEGKASRQDIQQQIAQVLNPEQQAKLEQLKEQRKNKRGQWRQRRGGERGPNAQ